MLAAGFSRRMVSVALHRALYIASTRPQARLPRLHKAHSIHASGQHGGVSTCLCAMRQAMGTGLALACWVMHADIGTLGSNSAQVASLRRRIHHAPFQTLASTARSPDGPVRSSATQSRGLDSPHGPPTHVEPTLRYSTADDSRAIGKATPTLHGLTRSQTRFIRAWPASLQPDELASLYAAVS